MTIGTTEELEAVPIGTDVRLRERGGATTATAWTRAEGGLRAANGIVLGIEHFAGYVAQGLIEQGPVYEPGQVYDRNGRYFYIILDAVRPDDRDGHAWWILTTRRNGDWVEMTARDTPQGTRVTDVPPWVGPVRSAALIALTNFRSWQVARAQVEEQTSRVAHETARVEQRIEAINARLLTYLELGHPEARESLAPVLAELGMRVPNVSVTVMAQVTAVQTVDLPLDAVPLPSGAALSGHPRARVAWELEVPVPVTVRPDWRCGCGHVGRREVRNALRDKSAEPVDFEFESRYCSHPQCRNAGNRPEGWVAPAPA